MTKVASSDVYLQTGTQTVYSLSTALV